MDFPLPVRSVSSVDYFTPLHVDTNIEYSLDMGKFPEINDPLHHWEPALVVASQCYHPTSSELERTSSSELDELIEYRLDMWIFPEINDPLHHWEPALVVASHSYQMSESGLEVTSSSELDELIDTYDIGDLQTDDMDFNLVDLPDTSLQSVLESTIEGSFVSELELDSICDSNLSERLCSGAENVENFPRTETSPDRRAKRKHSVSVISEDTQVCEEVYKRRKFEFSDQFAIENPICVAGNGGQRDFVHGSQPSPFGTCLRQW